MAAVNRTGRTAMPSRTWIAAVLLVAAPLAQAAGDQANAPYPEGYRSWFHVKSMLIEEGHPLSTDFGGLHHIYANDAALAGYRSGRFGDGAALVFDLLDVTRTDDHAVVEGGRKFVAVMLYDAQRFAETDGWGYEAWAGGDPARPVVGAEGMMGCHGCHLDAEPTHVFSRPRD